MTIDVSISLVTASLCFCNLQGKGGAEARLNTAHSADIVGEQAHTMGQAGLAVQYKAQPRVSIYSICFRA